jgi:hypothetical protein
MGRHGGAIDVARCFSFMADSGLLPIADRPHMPGYGLVPAAEGSGLLPWSWAEERLIRSHDYWLATVWPEGRPHLMPVWALWLNASLWFSCSRASRKTVNLLTQRRGVISTDDPRSPVVVEGVVDLVSDPELLRAVLDAENAKYGTDYGIELLDPAVSATFRLRPTWAFALSEHDFTGSPTRWRFD